MKAALVIDMPKNCLNCRVFNGRCIPLNADVDFYDGGRGSKERLPSCPLIPVPEKENTPVITCRKCGCPIHGKPHKITVHQNNNKEDIYNICDNCFENIIDIIDNFINEEEDY